MRSRIATAAVAASLIAGLGACSATSKAASDPAPTTPSATVSATATTAAAADPSSTASASSTASSSAASGTLSDSMLETMRSKVAAVYGMGVTPAPIFGAPAAIDSAELAADFDGQQAMQAVWGSGAAGADHPMDCGMAKYNGVAIGTVKSLGDAATVPVMLYEGTNAGTTAITLNLDLATGTIKGVACGGAPDPAGFPGLSPVAGYYGAVVSLKTSSLKSQQYFTTAFTAWQPADGDYDKQSCSQSGISRWIVALTGTTSSSSAWDFAPETVRSTADPASQHTPVGFLSSLAVDLGAAKISRVTCGGAYPPAAGGADVGEYATSLMEYYRLAADQKSLGVDPKAAIQPLFTSDDAFSQAWNSTGTVPLLCAKQVPGSVMMANGSAPAADGTRTTLKMVTWPQWHPDAPGHELSKFTLVLDTQTKKIVSITCTK